MQTTVKLSSDTDKQPVGIEDYHFDIENDTLVRYEPIEKTKAGGTLCKREPIMTKEAFLMCAKEWLGIDPKDYGERS